MMMMTMTLAMVMMSASVAYCCACAAAVKIINKYNFSASATTHHPQTQQLSPHKLHVTPKYNDTFSYTDENTRGP